MYKNVNLILHNIDSAQLTLGVFFLLFFFFQPTRHKEHFPYVQSIRQRRLWRGLRLPGACDRENVRVQEVREKAHQETERRGDGIE